MTQNPFVPVVCKCLCALHRRTIEAVCPRVDAIFNFCARIFAKRTFGNYSIVVWVKSARVWNVVVLADDKVRVAKN